MAEDTQLSLMGTPLADSTTSSVMTNIQNTQLSPMETQSANDPIILLAKLKAMIEEDLPAIWGTSPDRVEDPVAPTATSMDKSADPPTLVTIMESEGQEYSKWVNVHSSQKVAVAGSAPYKHEEPLWHHNCSSKWCKGTWCFLEEEWQNLGDVSMSASSEGSPEPAPHDEEGKGADPKGCSLGFWEIAQFLTARGTPKEEAHVYMDVPEAGATPIPPIEPMITTVISTSMGRDQRMGTVYVLTMTASMGIMNMEPPQWW